MIITRSLPEVMKISCEVYSEQWAVKTVEKLKNTCDHIPSLIYVCVCVYIYIYICYTKKTLVFGSLFECYLVKGRVVVL